MSYDQKRRQEPLESEWEYTDEEIPESSIGSSLIEEGDPEEAELISNGPPVPKESYEAEHVHRSEELTRRQLEELSRFDQFLDQETRQVEKDHVCRQRVWRRGRWTAKETDRLLQLWKEYGNDWVRIIEEDAAMLDSLLTGRTAVDLKDKIRNVKIGYLRYAKERI